MPSAEIITIGTEILLGEIVDTNACHIARKFRDAGINLYRKTTVGDNEERIAQAIRHAMQRCEIILTTGGLGPTIDDATRGAVALALETEVQFYPALWEQIQARFKRFNREPTENNKRQAYMPKGALPIENPVGTAPCFISEIEDHAIICLPGVPREMEYLLENSTIPYLRQRYQLSGMIKARILHTAGAGESQIDELIADLETLDNPTIGLSAHSGQVDVRITAKADTEQRADQLIEEVEKVVRQRLDAWIYGVDEDTLEEAALRNLDEHGWSLGVVESGLGGELIQRLSTISQGEDNEIARIFRGGEIIIDRPHPKDLVNVTSAFIQSRQAQVGLGVTIYPDGERQEVYIVIITPKGEQQFTRPYGGPPEYAPRWAFHHSLNLLRQL